jgi:serine/threonine-protein kinase
MGVIYRATDDALGREVAVKVLQERFTRESRTARRFADEARIAAELQYPAIPPVHEVSALTDGRPEPSDERGRYVAVFEQVCQALAYAHAHDLIHRDLQPANGMLGAFGEMQVMDWGLAKVLASRERQRPGEMA